MPYNGDLGKEGGRCGKNSSMIMPYKGDLGKEGGGAGRIVIIMPS